MKAFLVIIMLIINLSVANAHQSSTSFISLDASLPSPHNTGEWKVSINSLNDVKSMDINKDGFVKWSEIEQQYNEIILLLNRSLKISSAKNEKCKLKKNINSSLKLDTILDMKYILVPFSTDCILEEVTSINYSFYFSNDSDHKAILNVKKSASDSDIHVFSADTQSIDFNETSTNSFMSIVSEGIWHIWIGFDHIVFVLTLLIGIMFARNAMVLEGNHSQTKELIKVVTAFTVAHSITLGLAAYKIVNLPSQFVEASIAATLIIAALHNIRYLLPLKSREFLSWSIWKMAFVFGLIHGFGFANVLTELQLSTANIAKTILAFNLGVEIGQLVIVILFVALISLITVKNRSKNMVLENMLVYSSCFVILLGGAWFVERSFNLEVF